MAAAAAVIEVRSTMWPMSNPNRQSAGQPTGGQFATKTKGTDTGVDLGNAPAPQRPYRAPDWDTSDRRGRRINNFRDKTAQMVAGHDWPDGIEAHADEWADFVIIGQRTSHGYASTRVDLDPYNPASHDPEQILAVARENSERDSRRHYFTDDAKAAATALAATIGDHQQAAAPGEEGVTTSVHTYRLGSEQETQDEVDYAAANDEVVNDQSARTLASWYQSPGAGRNLAALASGAEFNTVELADEIDREVDDPAHRAALADWNDHLTALLSEED